MNSRSFRHLLQDLARVALAAGLIAVGVQQHGHAAEPSPGTPVKIQSLRGGTPLDQDNAPTPIRQERDHAPSDRDFVQQPPLIPHTISNYQITKNYNKCMDCHAFQKSKDSGAPKVSVTHFRTRDGQELDNISPRRYFCTQCHVPQTDAKPLVGNTFQRARGLQ
ncbi:nitrate reductase cytochrome c-type subunit [Sphaerotilus uruguayifluvii]|uniref:Periplasmic nitrate reductase, electron transfer subunit n=1 Tax=Sphaerotilus uruguayifluvii TaxID=2735897 RepID=A0ABX2FYC0_9BURK|nr:nitrate reductase cytochrome c-type subunit [Leptothrix sp. C29]NRT55018.1 cytochrome c-type protein NapB [Leptothrix sp. C29]